MATKKKSSKSGGAKVAAQSTAPKVQGAKAVKDLEDRVSRIENQLLGHLDGGPSTELLGGLPEDHVDPTQTTELPPRPESTAAAERTITNPGSTLG
jgi:hypothetical protein